MSRNRRTGSIRVLVVDDEPDFADMTATFLEREREAIAVETATSAAEGIARIEGDGPFDCVVSDYEMPRTNGLEFLEAARERHPDVPFILFTGKGSEEIASRAISAGVTDYLQKTGGTEQYERLANRIVHATRASRAESEADEARAHLRAVAASAADVILTIDESSTIRFVSEAIEPVFGYPPEAVEGEPLTMLMPERFRDRHRDALQRYLQDGTRRVDWTGVEFPGLHAAGHEVPLSISFGEFTLDGEQFFTGIVRDISDRKARERELEAARARTFAENALDALEDVFVVLDEDGSFLWWNERLTAVTGYTDGEIRSMRSVDLFADDDAERVADAIDECLRTGAARVDAEIVTEEGDRVPYEFRGRTFADPADDRIRIAGIGRDVSDREGSDRGS